jgi:hypothetical protein
MLFEDDEIGGVSTGAARIYIEGDRRRGQELIGTGQAMLGNLKQRMQLGHLLQGHDWRQYPEEKYTSTLFELLCNGELEGQNIPVEKAKKTGIQVTVNRYIEVSSIKGLADTDSIRIAVSVRYEEVGEGGNKCTAFVQVTRTSHLSDMSIRVDAWGAEPDVKSDNPDIMTWLMPRTIGNRVPAEYAEFDKYTTLEVNWNWTGVNNNSNDPTAQYAWKGFTDNGFAIRGGPDYAAVYQTNPNAYQLSLQSVETDIINEYPDTGPRIGTVAAGAPGEFHFSTGHWLYTDETAPYITWNTPTDDGLYGSYMLDVDYIHSKILTGEKAPNDYDLFDAFSSSTCATSNNLIATSSRIDVLKNNIFDFQTTTDDYTEKTYPYSALALLPKGSTVVANYMRDWVNDPDYGDWNDYTTGLYASIYDAIIDDGATYPYDRGTTDIYLYPSNYLHPLVTYIDFRVHRYWTINPIVSAAGHPKIVAKSGHYKVHVLAEQSVGNTSSPVPHNIIDDVTYDLDITLWTTQGIIKKKLHGITGIENDQLKILVETEAKGEDPFSSFVTIDR